MIKSVFEVIFLITVVSFAIQTDFLIIDLIRLSIIIISGLNIISRKRRARFNHKTKKNNNNIRIAA